MNYTTKTIIIVLVFSLISGGAGYYLGTLSTPAKTTTKATSSASSSATFNPFSSTSSSASTNPFESNGTYTNPFSNVKGASTGYTNPFDDFVNAANTSKEKTYRGL